MTNDTTAPPSEFALIELGLAEKRVRKHFIVATSDVGRAYLFDGTPEESIRDAGPLLIPLGPESPRVREALWQWETQYPSGLCYLVAHAGLDQLALHLRNRLTVVLPNGEERLFRFYAPDVMNLISRHIDNAQYFDFWRPINEWTFREKDGSWSRYVPDLSLRDEPVASRETVTPPAKQTLPEGHFRLNQTLWDALRWKADMHTVRAVIIDDTDYSWFARLPPQKQDEVFDEIVEQPLRAARLQGLEDLYTGATLAMCYPLHDVWANEQIQNAVREAQRSEGTLRAALARQVSAETWAKWAEEG